MMLSKVEDVVLVVRSLGISKIGRTDEKDINDKGTSFLSFY